MCLWRTPAWRWRSVWFMIAIAASEQICVAEKTEIADTTRCTVTGTMSSQSDSAASSDEDVDLGMLDDVGGDTKSPAKVTRSIQRLKAKEKALRHMLKMIEGENPPPLVPLPSTSAGTAVKAEVKEAQSSPERASIS